MTSNNAVSEVPQAGTVQYVVPVTVTVDLDNDEMFRGFSDEERKFAAGALVSVLASAVPLKDHIAVSAGEAEAAAA